MSHEDVKWIRLTTSMFDDDKIKLIEALPDRDALIVIWIKLLTQAGKTNANGYIYLTEDIPYTDEMLSTIFNRPVSTIRLALHTFARMGMIEWDGDRILVPNFEKHQNIEGLARIREQTRLKVARYRERLAAAGGDSYRQYSGMVLDRDGNRCVYCGSEENLVIDHLVPLLKGGDNEPDNLVAACRKCNSGKAGRFPDEAGYAFLNKGSQEQYEAVKVRLGNAVTVRNPTEVEVEEERDKNKKENTTTMVPILGGSFDIPGWNLDDGDLGWFSSLRGDFSSLSGVDMLDELKRCLDYHSGRKVPAHKGIWKNRFRNWLSQAVDIRARKAKNGGRRSHGAIPSRAELDVQEAKLKQKIKELE